MSNDTSPAPDYKYWAFISYSHQDNLLTRGDGGTDHILWANWLHEQLETFRVPDGYRDRLTRTGEPMPERFFPAFRDEAELPTSHDLGGQIRDALERSRFLIVIASPHSARSRYVNEEVRYFRELGRSDRILVLITDGEPNVRLHPKAGWTADDDCFCPALVHPLKADGTVDDTQLMREEPIAGDVRVKNIDPPREMRASESSHDNCRGVLDFMKLKLIAGLMGVGLDELIQRDKLRAEETLKKSRQEQSRTEFLFARHLLDLEDIPKAYARLSQSLGNDSQNQAATILGLEQVRRNNLRPLRQCLHEHAVGSATFSPCGSKILTLTGNAVFLWDAATGQALAEPLRHEGIAVSRIDGNQDLHELARIDGNRVHSAVFSPDGGMILTASQDKTARLWDAVTGQPLTEPLRHEHWVNSAVFSPDGERILTASRDNTARLWDAATGQALAEPLRHDGGVSSAVFSPDGERILTASEDNTARLWDASTGQALAEPLRHDGGVSSAVFSPGGERILTASSDNTARIWDAATGEALAEPLRHAGAVNSAVFSADGGRILTASWDKTARLWDATTGQPATGSLRHEAPVYSAVFSPDGGRILTASEDNTARLWDAATGQALADPLRHEGWVNSAVFSPEGEQILTASSDKIARLWDAATSRPLAEPLRHAGSVCSAVFSPDGRRILTASRDNTARLWDAATGQALAEPLRHDGGVSSAVFSPDGERILTASEDNTARLWDASTGQALAEPLHHEDCVYSAVFSPCGLKALTRSWNAAFLWDVATGLPLADSLRHERWLISAVFSPDGGRILTASEDNTARLWDAATGQVLAEPLRHEHWVRSAVFSPDGGGILTASMDKTARLWDAATGQLLTEPLRHEHWVNSAVFSPDGERILTTSEDNTARLWDAATGQPLADPFRHEGPVCSAVFSPDGRRILTASRDNTTRLWDAATGQPLAEPLRHEGSVWSAVFSPDGARILTASDDNTARLWDAATGEMLAEDTLRLRQLLEILGGHRLNERGLLEPVPLDDIERLRRDFDTATEMDRLLRWWWSDPFTRCIHPSSQITVPDFVRRRIREVLDWPDDQVKARALREARDAFPHHPLILLCLAEQNQHGDPAWLRQHAVSRLLTEPHYLTPLEPPNAIGDAKANRQYELTLGLAEDCFLGARLLIHDRTGQTRTTDPKRIELAKQVLARAMNLAPENEAYRKLAAEL